MARGILLRVGIDSQSGEWNAPCCNDGRFCYVPIPYGRNSERGPAFDHYYSEFKPYVEHMGVEWPSPLSGTCHLDPDFVHLTHGDQGARGMRIREFISAGDFIVFWSGLRSVHTKEIRCFIIGFYTVSCVVNASEVGSLDAHRNAHTRDNLAADCEDVVVFANPEKSGRLWKHIPIGRSRNGHQRVDRELLTAWGDLQTKDGKKWKDGYIQRSAAPPIFRNSAKFLKWFWAQKPKLVHANNI